MKYQYSVNSNYNSVQTQITEPAIRSNQVFPVDLEQIGQISDNQDGRSYGSDIQDQYLYVADASEGMEIYDLSDPTNPVLISRTTHTGNAYDILVDGFYAYVAFDFGGIHVYRIDDPTTPQYIGGFNAPNIVSLDIQDSYLFAADRSAGLCIYDISDPSQISLVSTYDDGDGGDSSDVAVHDTLVYLADRNYGFEVIDITDISNPIEVSNYTTGYNGYTANYVEINNEVLYFSESYQGVHILNITDPLNIYELATTDNNRNAEEVDIVGNLLYIATDDGMQIYDVTSPSSPTLLSEYLNSLSFRYPSVSVNGTYAYLAGLFRGMFIIDITDTNNPQFVSRTYNEGDTIQAIEVGNYVYTADDDGGVEIFDISTPSSPHEVGNYSYVGSDRNGVRQLILRGQTLFILDTSYGIISLNVSNPLHPVELGIYQFINDALYLEISGNYLYYTDSGSNLVVLNATLPTTLSKVTSININQTNARVGDLQDNILSLAGTDDLIELIDISDPAHPQYLQSIPIPLSNALDGITGLELNSTVLFVTTFYGQLIRIDLADIANPVLTEIEISSTFIREINIFNNWLIITTQKTIEIFDAYQLTNLDLRIQYSGLNFIESIFFGTDFIYISAGISGLVLIEKPDLIIQPPTIPYNLTAENLEIGIHLTWDMPNDTSYLPVTTYEIYRSGPDGDYLYLSSVNDSSLQFVDSRNVLVDENYTYFIKAVNRVGSSAFSTGFSINRVDVPTVPQNFMASLDSGEVSLSWIAPSYTGGEITFLIYRGIELDGLKLIKSDLTTFTYVDREVRTGETYYYQLAAQNSIGIGQKTAILNITITDTSSNPQNTDTPRLSYIFPILLLIGLIPIYRNRR